MNRDTETENEMRRESERSSENERTNEKKQSSSPFSSFLSPSVPLLKLLKSPKKHDSHGNETGRVAQLDRASDYEISTARNSFALCSGHHLGREEEERAKISFLSLLIRRSQVRALPWSLFFFFFTRCAEDRSKEREGEDAEKKEEKERLR